MAEEGLARGYLPPNVIHWGSARASAHCSRARCPVFGIETWGFPAPPTLSLVGSGVGGSFRASPAHTCDSAVCVSVGGCGCGCPCGCRLPPHSFILAVLRATRAAAATAVATTTKEQEHSQ